jgi:AraC family transcriptional regulator
VINEIIEYIECNICESLQLTDLSAQAGISDFHFNRIFKTVSGITLKQYVLGRKLTKALELLKNTDKSVIEIAMDLSFDYPEVFSRAFKKQFGLSPSDIRQQKIRVDGIKKAAIVERDIINLHEKIVQNQQNIIEYNRQITAKHNELTLSGDKFLEKLKEQLTKIYKHKKVVDVKIVG